jgi:DNA invertase Pin-like site-specific DNA recombinase
MPTIAYLRVSTGRQDLEQQKLAVLDYAQKHRFTVDEFIEAQRSSQQITQREELLTMIEGLQPNDRLIVSELSRLGRSLSQILQIIDHLIQRNVHLVAIKEAICFAGKQNIQTKAMIALFGLFAEVERDLIAERTKEGLVAAKARGQHLGRPKGARSKSKLDGKEGEIRVFLDKNISKASIARLMEVSQTTLHHFIKTRRLQPKRRKKGSQK